MTYGWHDDIALQKIATQTSYHSKNTIPGEHVKWLYMLSWVSLSWLPSLVQIDPVFEEIGLYA